MRDVKTLFLSDVHLGSRHAQTSALLEFLSQIKEQSPPERLYIIGDFIDGWKLRRKWYWNDESNLIIRKILSLVRCGTEVFYVAGNHDDFLRHFMHEYKLLEFGSITVGNEFVHETVDGRQLLVLHGDQFDLVTRYARWLSVLGDVGYEFLLKMNRYVNAVRRLFTHKRWSLSKAVKANVKRAVNFVGDFEKYLTAYAREKRCDGCVCGHIHTPEMKLWDDGFLYCNTGDWVESCTAIIEDGAGKLSLYRHDEYLDLKRENLCDDDFPAALAERMTSFCFTESEAAHT